MTIGASKRTTRILPDRDEASGWYETLTNTPPPAKSVEGSVECDWAIVGAGACGLAAARRLAELRDQDSIAVIDADRIGHGASGRNAGFMLNHNTHGEVKNLNVERRNSTLCAAGVDYLRNLVQEHQIQCHWSDWGRLYVAAEQHSNHHLTELCSNYDTLGVGYERIDRDRMKDMIGTGFYVSGMFAKGSALVQPAALMRGLGDTLPMNVTTFENSPVGDISRDGRFRLTCPGGVVEARDLILTTSVFIEEFGIGKMRIVPIATYGSLTRPLTDEELSHFGTESEFGLLPADPNGSTVRLTQDRRLFMRNSFSYARSKHIDAETVRYLEPVHRESIRRRWPALADVPFDSTWGGMLGFTRNDGTLFGQVEDGVYMAISSDASPVSRGSISGVLLAESICGLRSDLLDVMQSMPKAGLLPPDPILGMVVNYQLRKIERDGANEL